MNKRDDQINISQQALINIAQEAWRLSQLSETETHGSVPLRYSARKLRQTLEAEGCVFLDFTNKKYDAGMALEILDIEGEADDNDCELIIKEMIAPILLFHDQLLTSGQAVLLRRKK